MDTTWIMAAECAQAAADGLDFHSESKRMQKRCLRLCEECPVKLECLQYALDTEQVWGIWGGCTESELMSALSMNQKGETHDWDEPLVCPSCRTFSVDTVKKWRTRTIVRCTICDLSWRRRRVIKHRRKREPVQS